MPNSWLKGRQEQRQNKHEEETRHPQEKPLDRHSRGRRHSRRAVASMDEKLDLSEATKGIK